MHMQTYENVLNYTKTSTLKPSCINHDYIFRDIRLIGSSIAIPLESRHEKISFLPMRKTKAQISCAVTAQLISGLISLHGSKIPLLLTSEI